MKYYQLEIQDVQNPARNELWIPVKDKSSIAEQIYTHITKNYQYLLDIYVDENTLNSEDKILLSENNEINEIHKNDLIMMRRIVDKYYTCDDDGCECIIREWDII